MTYFEAKQGSPTGQGNDENPEANQVSQDSACKEAAGMQTRHTQTRNMKKATECLVSNECSCGR